MSEFSPDIIKNIEYIDYERLLGRHVVSLPYKDSSGNWIMWIPVDDKLEKVFAAPAEIEYVASQPDKESDVYLYFYNFLIKHLAYPEIYYIIESIRDDFLNLCTIIAKINTYFEIRGKYDVARFVATELEYLFVICRSFFDLLQEIIAKIWGHVKLKDDSRKKKNLPESFRKMVLLDKKLMTQNEIEEKFTIPPQLANFYNKTAPFFVSLRDYRDKIVHFGHETKSILVLDKGFAVGKDVEPFKSFSIWKDEDFYGTNSASLRPVLHHVITKTVETCDEFVKAITSCVSFPPSIIPKHNIYTRGYHTGAFTSLCNTIGEKRWWI